MVTIVGHKIGAPKVSSDLLRSALYCSRSSSQTSCVAHAALIPHYFRILTRCYYIVDGLHPLGNRGSVRPTGVPGRARASIRNQPRTLQQRVVDRWGTRIWTTRWDRKHSLHCWLGKGSRNGRGEPLSQFLSHGRTPHPVACKFTTVVGGNQRPTQWTIGSDPTIAQYAERRTGQGTIQ